MVGNEIAVAAVEHNSLQAWAEGARSVHALAEHVAQSALVPQAYRGKPVDVLACWLTGQELGIAPMAALRSIDNIQGTPSLRAHAMRALVQSHGHSVRIVESTDQRCVMTGRRKGDEEWQSVEWDIPRVKQLGVFDRNPQYKTQPRTMLIARATGEICRLIAADVLFAVPYTTEEMEDRPVRATATVTAADLTAPPAEPLPTAKATYEGRGVRLQSAMPETVVDIGDAEVVDSPAEQEASGPLVRKINLLLDQAGIDRDAKAAYVSEVIDRTVTAPKELTRTEAHKVMQELETLIAAKTPATVESGESNG